MQKMINTYYTKWYQSVTHCWIHWWKKNDFGSKMSMLWTKKLKPEVGGQIACFQSKMNVIENFTWHCKYQLENVTVYRIVMHWPSF